jgi:hypothetical protein
MLIRSITRPLEKALKVAETVAAGDLTSLIDVTGSDETSQLLAALKRMNDSLQRAVQEKSIIRKLRASWLSGRSLAAVRRAEQGRGFAVVASEVRALAQRSSSAAKEIKELIGTSVARVTTGTELVDQAGHTMKEIGDAVARVTDIMGEIAAASEEQSKGIEQVGHAISQMDSVTQQNAALVEQAAAAAQSLRDQAVHLDVAVAVFKLASGFSVMAAIPSSDRLSLETASPPITQNVLTRSRLPSDGTTFERQSTAKSGAVEVVPMPSEKVTLEQDWATF